MGRQRNNPQMKGKEEASERMLTEKKVSQLSDTEFKAWLSGRSLSSHSTSRNYGETTMNHCKLYQHQKGNRNYQQGPRGNREYNF